MTSSSGVGGAPVTGQEAETRDDYEPVRVPPEWPHVSVTLEWQNERGSGAVPNLRRCPECFAVVPHEFTAAHADWHRHVLAALTARPVVSGAHRG